MLTALLSLVASMGALSVLAGVVSGIIFLIDSLLQWTSVKRSYLEPWPAVRVSGHEDCNGVLGAGDLLKGSSSLVPVTRVSLQSLQSIQGIQSLQRLDAARPSGPSAGDGESRPGMADDGVPGVRQLMERLVESLVSGGLDDVVLRPKDPHPQYGRIFRRHQPRLRSALTSLAYSLQMAMAQKPLAECETPGRAHAQLRALILDLARDVAALERHAPHLQNGEANAIKEDFGTRAYEDILATAIVNKVMERSSSKSNRNNNNNNNKINNNFISNLEVHVGSLEDSPESLPSSYNGSWTASSPLDHSLEDSQDSDPLSLMIEECIEEVTTITATSSSSASSSSLDERSGPEEALRHVVRRRRRRRPSGRRAGSGGGLGLPLGLPPSGPASLIAGLSSLKQRVPFPELGVDIVDAVWSESDLSDASQHSDGGDVWRRGASSAASAAGGLPNGVHGGEEEEEEEERPASCLELVTPLQSWEDNWLFQSKRMRKPAAQYAHHPCPVPMLVPNPSEDFRALIGDVDAEETSDLSECSDDALEEVVLAGLDARTAADCSSDQFSEELGGPHLSGLAETCNLELLKRAAPALSTAPAPRAQRTDRTRNLDSPSTGTRLRPAGRAASRSPSPGAPAGTPAEAVTAPPAPAGRSVGSGVSPVEDSPVDCPVDSPADCPAEDCPTDSPVDYPADSPVDYPADCPADCPAEDCPTDSPVDCPADSPVDSPADCPADYPAGSSVDLAGRWARDQDAEMTIVYDTPTTKEAPPRDPGRASERAEVEQAVKVNGHATPVSEPGEDLDLFTPPRPGTIAEREHRKWMEATPLANNPYSSENIQRRLQQQRASLSGPSGAALGAGAAGLGASLPGTTLHIALRAEPDPKKYGRDFYINSRTSEQPGSGRRSVHLVGAVAAAGTPRPRCLAHGGPGGDLNGCACPPQDAPVAPWTVRTKGDGVDGGAEGPVQPAPSVKELARQFLSQPEDEPPQSCRSKPADGSRTVAPCKDGEGPARGALAALAAPKQDKRPVRQVHSLTARSMSREFREGLRHLSSGARAGAGGAASGASGGAATQAASQQGTPLHQGRPDPEGARQLTDPE